MARTRCVAIMAGGKGLRLWPRSTPRQPKQLRGFFGTPSLLEQSIARAVPLASADSTYVVVGSDLLEQTRPLVPQAVRLVAEPFGRDTAACIGLAALLAEHEHPGAVLTVLPADHWVNDDAAFARTLLQAADLAAASDGLVTVGVRPSRPETGYGYLLVEAPIDGVHLGKRFREKPSAQEAEALLAAGNALWNVGIFVARATTFLMQIGQHLPLLGAGLDRLARCLGTPAADQMLRQVYQEVAPISFDHGVAERLTDFRVIPAGFDWDDLGAWSAFGRTLPRDGAGNLLSGPVAAVDSSDCLVDTPAMRTLLLGVHGLIVVQEGDSLLIAHPDRVQDLKRAVQDLGLDLDR